jgi:hypothetical protein
MLERSFVWEARSLYVIAVVVVMLVLYRPVGLVIAGLEVLVVVVMVRPRITYLNYTSPVVKSKSDPAT